MPEAKHNNFMGITPLSPVVRLKEDFDKRLYTIPEMIGITQTSRRQIEYWTKIKLLIPTYRQLSSTIGNPATFYSAKEVVKAIIANDLRRSGFTLKQVQQVVHNLEITGVEIDKTEIYLLTDGYSVYYAFSDSEVVDIMKNSRQMLLMIPMHERLVRLKLAA